MHNIYAGESIDLFESHYISGISGVSASNYRLLIVLQGVEDRFQVSKFNVYRKT